MFEEAAARERNRGKAEYERSAGDAPSDVSEGSTIPRGNFRHYATRHRAKVAKVLSGVRSGLRVNSKTERFFNWT